MAAKTEVLTSSDRDRVLRALAECCAERGYQATTVTQVIERAGVPRETFDLLFTGKEACAIAALNQLASEILAKAATADRSGGLAQTLAGLRAVMELFAGQPASAYLGCIEARQGGTQRMHATYEAGLYMVAVMVARAQADHPALPPGAARAALGSSEALLRREIAAGRSAQLPQIIPALVYGAMAPLLGQREALRVARAARGAGGGRGVGQC